MARGCNFLTFVRRDTLQLRCFILHCTLIQESNYMKAVRVEKFGGLEALKIVDIPLADPGEGEARLKIEVIGVNFLDIYQRIGRYQ